MKKIILPIVVLALVSFGVINTKLSDAEREMAVKELAASQDHMLNVLDGLSEEQLNFKATPESWSIAECAEHITISEGNIGMDGMLKGTLASMADASKRAEVKMTDEQLLGMIKDRSNRVKTSEAFEPSGKFGSHEETVNAFKEKREAHIKYLKETEDDLRNRYGQLPFGTIDGLQILLFMSGHTERHVQQMEEVMAHSDFPEMAEMEEN